MHKIVNGFGSFFTKPPTFPNCVLLKFAFIQPKNYRFNTLASFFYIHFLSGSTFWPNARKSNVKKKQILNLSNSSEFFWNLLKVKKKPKN